LRVLLPERRREALVMDLRIEGFPCACRFESTFRGFKKAPVLAGFVAFGSFRALTRRFMRTGQNVRGYPQVSDLVWFCYIAERRNAPPHKRWTVRQLS
jgi:hypothetical protein